MINCPICGEIINDNAEKCPFCGYVLKEEGISRGEDAEKRDDADSARMSLRMQDAPVMMPQDSVIQWQPSEQTLDSVREWQPEGGFKPTVVLQNKYRKPFNPKPLIITLVSLFVLAAICFGGYMVFMSGKNKNGVPRRTDRKVRNTVEKGFDALEDMRLGDMIQMMLPKDLVMDIIRQIGTTSAGNQISIDEQQIETYYDMLLAMLNMGGQYGMKADISGLRIGTSYKIDIYEKLNELYDFIRDEDNQELVAELFDGEIPDITQVDIDDAYRELEKIAEEIGIDLNEIYAVDVSFMCYLTVQGEEYHFSDVDMPCVYLYKYNGEFYFIPGFSGALTENSILDGLDDH